MSCDVRRQVLADFSKVGYFGKVRVHALVGYYRYHEVLRHRFRVVAVFLCNPFRDVEQGDGADLADLLVRLAYPFLAVLILNYMVAGKSGYVSEGKSAEAIENYQCNQ